MRVLPQLRSRAKMERMADSRRTIGRAALVAVPGALVVVSTLLPWSTHEHRQLGTTTEYGAGSVGYLLTALAVAAVVCAIASDWYRSPLLRALAIAYGIGCVGCSIVLATTTLLDANDAASNHLGGSQTARAAGATLGTIGAAALLIACCVLPQIDAGGGRGTRLASSLCYVAGAIFTAVFSLIFLTKFTSLFSDLQADLVMVVLGLAAYACCRAGGRLRRAPVSVTTTR